MTPKTRPFVRLLATTVAAVSLTPTLPAQDFPDVVARVEGYEIQKEELVTQAEILRAQARQAGQTDPGSGEEFYRQVLDGLVGELLVYADAIERGVGATGNEVDAAVEKMRSRFSSPEVFDQQLAQQEVTMAELRAQLERTLTIEKVIREEIAPNVQLPENAAREFWQQNQEAIRTAEQRRVRHVFLLPEGEGGWEKARAKARALVEQLAGGADFAELARQFSDDAGSKERGGELGWVEAGSARSELASAALAMDAGRGPQVVETEEGVHVVDLLEVRPSRIPSFEEAGPRIEKKMRDYLIQVQVVNRTEALREGAEIEILL